MIILIAEAQDYSHNALDIYRAIGEVRQFEKCSRAELLEAVKDMDVLIVRLGHQIDEEVLDAAARLKVIGTPTTGLDHIDVTAAEKRNISVLSLKGERTFLESIAATPEHTLALILALLRNVPQAHNHVQAGGWNRNLFKGYEIKNRTFGFYGCGRVAKLLAKYLQCMGARIIAYDPYVSEDDMRSMNIEPVSRNEVFTQSDTLCVLCILNVETEGSITYDDFARMKKGAQLINTARGQILNEDDMVRALSEGIIAKAAVDVAAGERDGDEWMAESPLIRYAQTHDNLIVTPHIAGATYDSMAATEQFIANKVQQHIRTYE